MGFKDYYKVLGVAEPTTQLGIKQAYRKLARKFHPDVSKEQDADARFKALGEAYAVLKDARKRTEYDQFMALHSAGGERRSSGASADRGDDEVSRHFRGFSESAFSADQAGCGGHRPSVDRDRCASSSHRGRDLHQRIALSLEEAVQGIQRTVKLDVPTTATSGRPCTKSKTLKVKIPGGVAPGQLIRLVGQGGPGVQGGATGDFFLGIELAPHPLFVVAGRDVLLNLPVTSWEVALGEKVNVPTLAGPVKLTIPTDSVNGKKLRLKGRGLGLNPTGDLIVNLQVTTPDQHWTKAEALYREVAAESAGPPSGRQFL